MKLSSPCDSIQQTPIWKTARGPPTLPTLLAKRYAWGVLDKMLPVLWGCRSSNAPSRYPDQPGEVPVSPPAEHWRKPHFRDTAWSGEEGPLEKGKEKKPQDLVFSNPCNEKINRDKLWQHSVFFKAITFHLMRVTQQRGTAMPALIKFVQLIPKSHHDTVKQEAAEEPHREYNQLLLKWVETRHPYQRNS